MNILVVKLSAIGDVIHALPVSYAIKETFPSARLTWAVEPPARELLVDNPYIDEILLFEKKKFKSFGGKSSATAISALRWICKDWGNRRQSPIFLARRDGSAPAICGK